MRLQIVSSSLDYGYLARYMLESTFLLNSSSVLSWGTRDHGKRRFEQIYFSISPALYARVLFTSYSHIATVADAEAGGRTRDSSRKFERET